MTRQRTSPAESAFLQGRTALVTGAGGGIGRACARRPAALGARVVAVDVDGEAARRVAGGVAASGARPRR